MVLDEPGKYNGLDIKWVDVTILNNKFEQTLTQLKKLGFSGCWALVYGENEHFKQTTDEVFIKI